EQDNKLVTFDPTSRSLLQINGPGGFTQVTKNGSDFQPRLGVIWNPKGDGKTVVRGAYAIMVNQSNTGYFAGETGNPPIVTPLSATSPSRPASARPTTRVCGSPRIIGSAAACSSRAPTRSRSRPTPTPMTAR